MLSQLARQLFGRATALCPAGSAAWLEGYQTASASAPLVAGLHTLVGVRASVCSTAAELPCCSHRAATSCVSHQLPAAGNSSRLAMSSAASVAAVPDQPSSTNSSSGGSSQTAPRPPWTATQDLTKRKTLTKRMGFLMQVLESEFADAAAKQSNLPSFGPGDVVEVKLSVPENKRRPAIFKGTCIAFKQRGWRSAFTLRNHFGTAGGVERTFPLYAPNLLAIKVLERRKVRRAKLYYLRGRKPGEYNA